METEVRDEEGRDAPANVDGAERAFAAADVDGAEGAFRAADGAVFTAGLAVFGGSLLTGAAEEAALLGRIRCFRRDSGQLSKWPENHEKHEILIKYTVCKHQEKS